MRSSLGGHYAGSGTSLSLFDNEDPYQDRREPVRLPSDYVDHSTLSGPVRTYNLCTNTKVVQLLPDCEVCGCRMDSKFLRPWNDRRVCAPCIDELMVEVQV